MLKNFKCSEKFRSVRFFIASALRIIPRLPFVDQFLFAFLNCICANPSIMSFDKHFPSFIRLRMDFFYYLLFICSHRNYTEMLREYIQNTWKKFIKSNVRALFVRFSVCFFFFNFNLLCVHFQNYRIQCVVRFYEQWFNQWNNVKYSIYRLNERFSQQSDYCCQFRDRTLTTKIIIMKMYQHDYQIQTTNSRAAIVDGR